MARILLVDVDSVWFNLALMKISTYHKSRGDEVSLIRLPRRRYDRFGHHPNLAINSPMHKFDKAYISCIFTKNASKARSIAIMLESMGIPIECGGSGIDLHTKLQDEVEHCCPDYSLYNLNYSVGFITRGCIRNCPWCLVPLKEGNIRFHSKLKEFLRHRRVMLLDNNLLAYNNHIKILEELVKERVEVCFTQGLDIRLIDNENAKWLRLVRYRDTEFKKPRLYFSWDTLEIEDSVIKGIEILKRHGIPPNHCLFYMLCGFKIRPEDYTWEYFLENDWRRYETLVKLGTLPFVMKWNGRTDIPLLNAFSRWVNHAHKARKKSLGLLESFKTWIKHEYKKRLGFEI